MLKRLVDPAETGVARLDPLLDATPADVQRGGVVGDGGRLRPGEQAWVARGNARGQLGGAQAGGRPDHAEQCFAPSWIECQCPLVQRQRTHPVAGRLGDGGARAEQFGTAGGVASGRQRLVEQLDRGRVLALVGQRQRQSDAAFDPVRELAIARR